MTRFTIASKPLQSTLNNFVEDLFNEIPASFRNDFNKPGRNGSVPVNVKETEKGYQLELVAPGFEKSDFKVHIDRELLTISASREIKTDQNVKMIRNEFRLSSFKRSFTIDEKIDATQIEASYVNGVLLLNLPKKEEVKIPATQIEIK